MSNNVFTVKLPDFPIFNKPFIGKENTKAKKQIPSVDLPKEEGSKKLKSKHLLYIVYPLIFFGALGIYLYLSNYFSDRELSETSSTDQAEAEAEATPKPIIKPLPTGKQIYNYSHGKNVVGPKPTQVIIDPIDPKTGDTQTLTITLPHDKPVTNTKATLITDNESTAINLTKELEDTYVANWRMTDSYDYKYQITFEFSDNTETFSGAVTFR